MNNGNVPRQEVENLQRYLRQLSFFEEGLLRPPLDGLFDSATEDSLRRYQEMRDLPPTGRADRRTWELLYEEYRASLAENSPPRAIEVYPRERAEQDLSLGSRGFDVSAVQYLLQEPAYLYAGFDAVSVTGEYDAVTAAAVEKFQARNFIPPTGRVDLVTWNSLADQYNLIFSRSSEE